MELSAGRLAVLIDLARAWGGWYFDTETAILVSVPGDGYTAVEIDVPIVYPPGLDVLERAGYELAVRADVKEAMRSCEPELHIYTDRRSISLEGNRMVYLFDDFPF